MVRPAASPTRTTAVVTDSTAHLSAEETADLGVTVVPLEVVIAGQTGLDGVDVTPAQVAAALEAWQPVSTSRPPPARFLAAYEQARAEGAEEVVSVHVSGSLSGTVDAARIAARDAGLPVTVIDSRQVGLGLGFAALAAGRAARDGAAGAEVAEVARRIAASAGMFFYVDTLEYLKRGGRIGAAAAFFGGVLAVKPILRVEDGRIEPVERVRTSARALARLEELAVAEAGTRRVRVGVHHLDASHRAVMVRDSLAARLPDAAPVLVRELGAVIGAHVGPGVVAVVVVPDGDVPGA